MVEKARIDDLLISFYVEKTNVTVVFHPSTMEICAFPLVGCEPLVECFAINADGTKEVYSFEQGLHQRSTAFR